MNPTRCSTTDASSAIPASLTAASSCSARIRVVEERDVKQRFCEMLMQKYGKPDTGRPKGFFPRLDIITVYAIAVERITGKQQAMPAQQWPEVDFTRTPNARAP